METRDGQQFGFGLFRVDVAAGELWRGERRVPLQEQPFRLLVQLLERAGAVVSREELRTHLWSTDTFVEFDQGLNTAIKKLRQALRDSAENPRFIETVPRKGYRFIAPVADPSPPSTAAPQPMRGRYWLAGAAVAMAGAAAFWLLRPGPARPPALPIPLTSYAGVEDQPSFSPDGRQVAFMWNGERQDNNDIYIKQLGIDTPRRLTTDPAEDFSPAWSPDGRLIAFARFLGNARAAILVTPPVGGPEVKVAEVSSPVNFLHAGSPAERSYSQPLLAWSPDGKWLAVTDTDGSAPARSMFLVSLENGQRRRLTSQPEYPVVDAAPAFSPDGRMLAFVRGVNQVADLYLLSLSPQGEPAGKPERLTSGSQHIASPVWTPDGASVVFVGGSYHESRLYRIPLRGKRVALPIEFLGTGVTAAALSRQGKLAYAQRSGHGGIWRAELSGPGGVAAPPQPFLVSSRTQINPHYSPDGKRIVFGSSRGGPEEIWIASSDGSNPVQLTAMRASNTGGPNWSPDGSQIAFDSTKEGQWEVYTISAIGGAPRRMTLSPATDGVPSWSRDGRSIYFMSTRSGRREVWKMPATGGPALQVTKSGGYVSEESLDGRWLYFSRSGELWKMPVGGGEETQVLPSITFLNFDVTNDGIYFIPVSGAREPDSVWFLSFATGKSAPVFALSGRQVSGLAVSPDGKYLLYSQVDRVSSELMLVDDFR